MTEKSERQERVSRRRQERALIAKGFVRVKPYLANLALHNDLPLEKGPHWDPKNECVVHWVPAWLEWHMQRFVSTSLSEVSQRERLEQAKELLHDKEQQLLLLCEAQLAGSTLEDPTGDLATIAAIELLKKEIGSKE